MMKGSGIEGMEMVEDRRQTGEGARRLFGLETRANQAVTLLKQGGKLSLEQITDALEALLVVKDLPPLQAALQQLPQQAFTHPGIIAVYLKYLFASGDRSQAVRFAQDIRNNPNRTHNDNIENLLDCVLRPVPEQKDLQRPHLLDYAFDLDDSHYSMKLLLECSNCRQLHLEKIGWGIMILRVSFCPGCLIPVLISPDFLVETLDIYHTHDGGTGIRQIDRELYRLVSEWHLEEGYPEEGYFKDSSLAGPLMLPILRHLIRDMYLERYVNLGEAAQ